MEANGILKYDLQRKILYEFAEAMDRTLLPPATISSIGLKLAIARKERFDSLLNANKGLPEREAFVKALVELFSEELHYTPLLDEVRDDKIRFKIPFCPFKSARSKSLCSIVQGLVGGFAVMRFGYCKIIKTDGQSHDKKPCYMDVYIKQTPEAESKIGFEYSKDNIALLRGVDEGVAAQRQVSRKILLSLFNNLTLSLSEYGSEYDVVKDFISGLTGIPGVMAAAAFLIDAESKTFRRIVDFGFPEEFIPESGNIGQLAGRKLNSDDDMLSVIESLNGYTSDDLKEHSIRILTTVDIRSKDRLVGGVCIGWKSLSNIDPELSQSLHSACILLGTVINSNRLYSELEQVHIDSISMLNELVEAVDRFSHDHSKQVAEISEQIARKMGLSEDETNLIYQAAIVHDVGKIAIPSDIFNKPGPLTPKEFALVKEHPVVGAKLVAPIKVFSRLVPVIRHHHERLDGSGYPDGLRGEDIPLYARIVAVADSYCAMICNRAHRESLGEAEALNELVSESGTKYDEAAVSALQEVLKEAEVLEVS